MKEDMKMKRYRELGIIKDGNKIDSYVCYVFPGQINPCAVPWEIATAEQFKELVKNEEMQHFQYDAKTDKVL